MTSRWRRATSTAVWQQTGSPSDGVSDGLADAQRRLCGSVAPWARRGGGFASPHRQFVMGSPSSAAFAVLSASSAPAPRVNTRSAPLTAAPSRGGAVPSRDRQAAARDRGSRGRHLPRSLGLARQQLRPRVAAGGAVCAAMGTDEKAGPADTSVADANGLPALVVFDLDACLWDQEMFQLYDLVDASNPVMGELGDAGRGVVGAKSGSTVIRLHRGALLALQKIHSGEYTGLRAAAASSADTPLAVKIGRSALDVLEVVPGVTVRQVLAQGWPEGFEGNLQIGRTPPLSSNKAATHFPRLKAFTGVPFDRMLFFDDCNWGDHCTAVRLSLSASDAVRTGCVEQSSGLGPATVKTPRGLQPADWENGLKTYKLQSERLR